MKNKKRKFTRFRPQIRSRHPSHTILRGKGALPTFPFKSVIRFGSSTELEDTIDNGGRRLEINKVSAIKNSANKKLMKTCFKDNNVRTAIWYTFKQGLLFDEINKKSVQINDLEFPIVSKQIFGSRGKGNTKINSLSEFKVFIGNSSRILNNYIFEQFYNYAREYRLHITEEGCFYSCRKMMKRDTPDENKWYKNDNNCVWVLENNPNFDKPVNWKDVEIESVKALKAVGLDFGAVDLRIQSSTKANGEKNAYPSFIVVEINSAPSFGAITGMKYKDMLVNLINKKRKQQ